MDKRLLRTLGFALVAGVFFGLAYGGMRNRIVFETAQMYDGLHSVELDSLRYQLDTLNQSYRDLLEIKVYDRNQVSRLSDDRNVLQVELNQLRDRYSSLEEAYYALKEKYEPEPPQNETYDEDGGFGGFSSVSIVEHVFSIFPKLPSHVEVQHLWVQWMGSIEDHPNVPVTELPYTFLTIREEYSGSLKFIVMRQEPMTENEQALWDMKMEAFWQSWICHVSAMPH